MIWFYLLHVILYSIILYTQDYNNFIALIIIYNEHKIIWLPNSGCREITLSVEYLLGAENMYSVSDTCTES